MQSVAAGGLLEVDEAEDAFVFVLSGAGKLVAHASGGREQILAFHFPGDIIAMPAQGVHAYTFVALTPFKALVLSAASLLSGVSSRPEELEKVLRQVLRSLARSREKAIALGRKTAQERLAGFLVNMAERIGRAEGKRCILHLPMSRRDVADSLGLTIETVSRQLGELRCDGLLETSGRSEVVLLDTDELASRAGHLSN